MARISHLGGGIFELKEKQLGQVLNIERVISSAEHRLRELIDEPKYMEDGFRVARWWPKAVDEII